MSSITSQAQILPSRTGHITLMKPVKENDTDVAILRSHPEIRKDLRYYPEIFSPDDARLHRESRAADPTLHNFHIFQIQQPNGDREEKATTTLFIGTAILHMNELHRSCEAGLLITPDIQRRGAGTDVLYTLFSYIFEELKLHRVYMKTSSTNVAMKAWLEKVAGARLEMEEREGWLDLIDSRGFSDVSGYAILDWEWHGRVKGALESRLGSTTIVRDMPGIDR
ncbi:acyl-CoA N-acyltransferase [Gymnopus androsaceus JB14]|uniref:Acyl-CoA N-acyltransferase n=1 Tax=Gymnopus androsaceus JB14 TaxID=1447944 RepID=A0A6A4I0M6_9AGAR|nr:acyl-CoA N-acyltransferase [Gymnopus androsaceus JB14]